MIYPRCDINISLGLALETTGTEGKSKIRLTFLSGLIQVFII